MMRAIDTPAPQSAAGAAFDYLVFPFFLVTMYASARLLFAHGVHALFVTPLVVGPFAALAAVLERVRPERQAHVPLDQPLWIEAVHFVFDFELGYGLAMLLCEAFRHVLTTYVSVSLWPASLPFVLEVALGLFLYESLSYWQHRFIHRVPWFFRFHALHHSGARLNLVRAGRFHFVDLGTAAVAAFVPLVALGAPEPVVTTTVVVLSGLGIMQHANIRMRTPPWLDRLLCTPAVHRHHHSIDAGESDGNFANSFMLFDIVFGTYRVPRPDGPAMTGLEDDPVPRDPWRQIFGPFRRRELNVTTRRCEADESAR